jgi:hypothetical protein
MSLLSQLLDADVLQSRSFLLSETTPNNCPAANQGSAWIICSKGTLFLNMALLRVTVAAQPPPDTGGMDDSMMITNSFDPTWLRSDSGLS